MTALLITMALLGSCGNRTATRYTSDSNRLAPCSTEGTVFASQPFTSWSTIYHTTVSNVIRAHSDAMQNLNAAGLRCTAGTYAGVVQPTEELKKLAAKLAPWKDNDKWKDLSESELGPVLLEFLRTYECALSDRNNFLSLAVSGDNASSAASAGEDPGSMKIFDFIRQKTEERRIIQHELDISRSTLDRTLLIIGGEDRLRPLSVDIECLKRVSLDIRNVLGLVSQASACLPKVRDARGSLRDLPEEK